MSLPKFGTGDSALFATKRTHEAIVIEPKTLAQVTALMVDHGLVQGQEFYTASQAETDVYNGKRETAAKSAGKDVPEPINRVAMAIRKARADGNTIVPYVEAAIAAAPEPTDDKPSPLFGKVPSLRTVNQGSDDNPRVLWAIVLANPRNRESK